MRISGVVAIALTASGGLARADTLITGSLEHRAASVNFAAVGNELVVTLTNTTAVDALVPADVLTAIFFDISGSPVSLNPLSATLDSGSLVRFGTPDPGGVVGGEWAYTDDPMAGFNHGISSTGLSIFGPGDRFPGNNLQGPASPDGLQYGITSQGDNPATGNTPMTGENALIQNSVVFRLGGLPAGFDLGRIEEVRFQYGTSLSEPHFPGIPSPGSLALLSLAGLLAARRRRFA